MANTIRIKRRTTGVAGAPSSLAVGELAYNEIDNKMYIGTLGNGVIPVAGVGEFVRLAAVDQEIAGVKTFTSHPIVSATILTTSDSSTKVATTAWVKSLGYTTTGQTDLSFGTITSTEIPLNSSTGTDVTFVSATTALAGLMSAADKTKLNGIASGATANTGTVTSVGISLPTSVFTNGSAVTTSGNLSATFVNQTTNQVFAAPSGSTGTPTFRALVAADIPTLTVAKISGFDTQVRTNSLDQMAQPTADVAFNNQKITGLADPTNAQDAATKAYVDSTAQGLDVKESVRIATTANITLSGLTAIDGITPVAGNRILVKNQSTGSQNGIYEAASGAWTRAADFVTGKVSAGSFVFVEEGTTNADSGWVLTNDGAVTVGTTALTFAQFSGAGQIGAGGGLTKSGNTLNVGGTANRITVTADAVDIASNYVGQTSITTLGTIGSGTWNATTIATNKGGTGLTSFTSGGAVYATSTSALTTGTLPVASGGTGRSTLTTNAILYGNGAGQVGLAGPGTIDANGIGQILSVTTGGVPAWTDTLDGGTF